MISKEFSKAGVNTVKKFVDEATRKEGGQV